MKDNKTKSKLPDEEMIGVLLKSDIDAAAKNAGNLNEILDGAYGSIPQVKRGGRTFIIPAVCCAVLALVLGFTQIFSVDFYDFSTAKSAKEEGNSSSTLISEGTDADNYTRLCLLSTTCGEYTDDGEPASNDYTLSYSFTSGLTYNSTDTQIAYTYVICEGDVLYSGANQLTSNKLSEEISFSLNDITDCRYVFTYIVTVCISTDSSGAIKSKSAIDRIELENVNFNSDYADMAYDSCDEAVEITYEYKQDTEVYSPSVKLETIEDSTPAMILLNQDESLSDMWDMVLIKLTLNSLDSDSYKTINNIDLSLADMITDNNVYQTAIATIKIEDFLDISDDSLVFAIATGHDYGESALSSVYSMSE